MGSYLVASCSFLPPNFAVAAEETPKAQRLNRVKASGKTEVEFLSVVFQSPQLHLEKRATSAYGKDKTRA